MWFLKNHLSGYFRENPTVMSFIVVDNLGDGQTNNLDGWLLLLLVWVSAGENPVTRVVVLLLGCVRVTCGVMRSYEPSVCRGGRSRLLLLLPTRIREGLSQHLMCMNWLVDYEVIWLEWALRPLSGRAPCELISLREKDMRPRRSISKLGLYRGSYDIPHRCGVGRWRSILRRRETGKDCLGYFQEAAWYLHGSCRLARALRLVRVWARGGNAFEGSVGGDDLDRQLKVLTLGAGIGVIVDHWVLKLDIIKALTFCALLAL